MIPVVAAVDVADSVVVVVVVVAAAADDGGPLVVAEEASRASCMPWRSRETAQSPGKQQDGTLPMALSLVLLLVTDLTSRSFRE